MQTTYRLKARDISANFLKSVKSLFAGEEIEITIKTVEKNKPELTPAQEAILLLVAENRKNAPVISKDYDIRALIDESQYPEK